MKKLIVGAILALSATTTAVANDQGPKTHHCNLVGSYVTKAGESFSQWTVRTSGTENSGTLTTDVPAWPAPMPPGVKVIPSVGVWQRTGPNTFAFTQIFWAVDPSGAMFSYFRNSGIDTLTDDCNVLLVDSTMEAFNPDGSKHPLGIPGTDTNANLLPPMTGHRVLLQPPAEDAVPFPAP